MTFEMGVGTDPSRSEMRPLPIDSSHAQGTKAI